MRRWYEHRIPPPVIDLACAVAMAWLAGAVPAARLWPPGGAWWVWAALGVGLSGGIEFAQFLLLDSRVPDLRDVVANGLGGALGAWLGTVCTRTRVA